MHATRSETEYRRPPDVESACRLLADADDAAVLAGGQSLSLMIREGELDPDVLLDVSDLDELQGIELADGQLRLGATTTYREIETSELCRRERPSLPETAARIGDVQVRNAGTIGGAVALADGAGDFPTVLAALDATIRTRTSDRSRSYAASDFFAGENPLSDDEIVTGVQLPADRRLGAGFEKLALRQNGPAMVNAAAAVRIRRGRCRAARICVGGSRHARRLHERASRELVGTDVGDDRIAAAADVVRDAGQGSERDYNSEMAGTLVEDALAAARRRAGSS